jgi:hypothetical protein
MRFLADVPLTDDNGVPLTEPPIVHYCRECIRLNIEEPVLFTLEEIKGP